MRFAFRRIFTETVSTITVLLLVSVLLLLYNSAVVNSQNTSVTQCYVSLSQFIRYKLPNMNVIIGLALVQL